jgi:tRNA pseudouridine55 synthase
MGQQIGCGAHLASLRRTALGEFNLTDAHTLEALSAASQVGQSDELSAMFVHARRLLPQFPCVTASDEAVAYIRSGRAVNLPELSQAKMVKVFASQRELIAIASRIAGTLFHPKIVLAGASPLQMANGRMG